VLPVNVCFKMSKQKKKRSEFPSRRSVVFDRSGTQYRLQSAGPIDWNENDVCIQGVAGHSSTVLLACAARQVRVTVYAA
jgi:hypothetical protein